MKIYTIFTDSHQQLLHEYFIPSLYNNINYSEPKPIDIIIKKIPQFCPTATYGRKGWMETMLNKVDQHIEACEYNLGKQFIYFDCDVQFFKPFIDDMIEELGDFDIACQNDIFPYENRQTYCAGMFICNANEKTLDFFKSIRKNMVENSYRPHEYNDQVALNENLYKIKHKLLSCKFYTIAQTTNCLWDNNYNINNIPNNISIHHANWTHGVDNKIKLLNFIKTKQI